MELARLKEGDWHIVNRKTLFLSISEPIDTRFYGGNNGRK